jgi:hypothetical protein
MRLYAHLDVLPFYTIGLYAIAACLVFNLFDEHRCLMLPEERTAAAMSAAGLACVIGTGFSRLAIERPPRQLPVAIMAVQFVSFLSKVVIALGFAVPVVQDPVTGCRVHLWRLTEWTVLAYGMTMLNEIVSTESDQHHSIKTCACIATSQGLSVFCAFCLPFCPNAVVFGLVLAISCALAGVVFSKHIVKTRRYFDNPTNLSYKLAWFLSTNTVCTWSIFIISYFAAWTCDRYSGFWPFSLDLLFDTISKTTMAACINEADLRGRGAQIADQHHATSEMLHYVWNKCGDTFAVCTQSAVTGDQRILVSPAVRSLLSLESCPVEFTLPKDEDVDTPPGTQDLAGLIRQALAGERQDAYSLLPYDLSLLSGDLVHCEVGRSQISANENNEPVHLLTIRDITARVRCQEIEKMLVIHNKVLVQTPS